MPFDDGKKTVSGSIAHTDDAATKVPFVSVKCGIEPTLTGVTEIDVVRPDGNILQTVAESKEQNGVTWTVNSDGSITLSGKSTARTYLYVHLYHKILPKDATLTVSVEGLYDNGASDVFLNLPYSDNGTTYSGTYGQVTWGSPKKTISYTADKYLGFLLDCPANVTTNQTVKIMVTIGSDAKAFEPYQTPETKTADLGRTIYGGSVDVVNGTGTDENTKFTVTADMADSIRYIGSGNTAYIQINKTPASNGRWQDLACSHFTPANIYAGGTQQGIGCYSSQFYIRDSRFTSKQDFLDFLTEQETLGTPLEICYKLATPTDFTFTPITPTPETVGKVNNVYCNTGNTELTYYDNAHGFSEVTVNKTGKNLFGGWTKGYGVNSTTGEIFSRQDSAISDYISVVPNTNYYISGFSDEISSMVAYYDRNKTYISRTSGSQRLSLAVTTPTNCRYMILYQYRAGDQTASIDVIDNMQTQLEFGSEQTEYEPYVVPISKTAYLHKVIYGGQADVVRGTAKPKNLFDDSTFPRTATDNTYYAQFQSNLAEGNKYKIPAIHIEPDVAYVLSFNVECNTEPFNASVGIGIGSYSRDIANANNNTSGRISVPFTLTSALKEQYGDILSFRVPRYSTPREFTFTISNVQLEKASTASDFAPYFDPFTFPPISIGTDEGENTLFAIQGDSAITYRKAVD